jgi:GMP synthase (glutamine-hydrolysing)
MRILLIITGHTIEPVRSQFENTDSHFSRAASERAQLVPYAICDTDASSAPLDLSEFNGVIMTGSAAMLADNQPWMQGAMKLVEQCVRDDRPFLGVCFGHQMLGAVCGAKVGPNPNGRRNGSCLVEVKQPSPLFEGLPTTFHAQVSHRDVILEDRPEFLITATTAHDPRHSIQVGTNVFGVQFHPEWNMDVSRAYIDARQETLGVEAAARMRDTLQPSPSATLVVKRFLERCG